MAYPTSQENNEFIRLVARAALAQSRHLLTTWPETAGGKVMGREYFCSNPTRRDNNPTNFSVNIDTGEWNDLATTKKEDSGTDFVALYAYVKGIRHQTDAAKLLANELGMGNYTVQEVERVVATLPPPKPVRQRPQPTYPAIGECPYSVIESYAQWFTVNKAGGAPVEITRQFRYLDSEGRLMGLIVRMDYELNGKPEKITPPFFCFDGKWKAQGPHGLNSKPLFGLDQLAKKPDAPVLVVEGEKCALHGQDNVPDYAVVSWMGGVKGIKYADWAPLLGRDIVIWPDNDLEGFKAAKQIQSIVKGRLLAVPKGMPPKWDIADASLDEIRRVLNPDNKPTAIEAVKEYDNLLEDNEYYTVKGYSKGANGKPEYHFFKKKTITLETLSHDEITGKGLTRLVPSKNFWFDLAPHCKTLNDAFFECGLDVIQLCERTYFDTSSTCGLGAWNDLLSPSGFVFHAGDRLIIDRNQEIALNDIQLNNCYERRPKAKLAPDELTEDEGKEFINILELLNFADHHYAYALAGWLFLAPICCTLSWRPHIYLKGGRGSGKSWVVKKIILAALDSFCKGYEGGSSVAGIYQDLSIDSLPVVIDEMDAYEETDKKRIQNIYGFSRESSSSEGTSRVKGTSGGKAISYKPRSMFCFSSIMASNSKDADKSRTTEIELTANSKPVGYFEKAKEMRKQLMNATFAPRLLRRSVNSMGRIQAIYDAFSSKIEEMTGSARNTQQIAMLATGYWCLTNDKDPINHELHHISFIFSKFVEAVTKTDNEHEKILKAIMEHLVQVVEMQGYNTIRKDKSLLSIVKDASEANGTSLKELNTTLGNYGIKVQDGFVYFAPAHSAIVKIIKGKTFADENYSDALKRHPDAVSKNSSIGLTKGRLIGIPTAYILSLNPFTDLE